MVPREETLDGEIFKGDSDHSPCRLLGKALPPVLGPKVKSQFQKLLILSSVRPQPRTSGELSILEQKHWPVLNLVDELHFDLASEACTNLFLCERTTDHHETLGSPQSVMAKAKSSSFQWLKPRRSVVKKYGRVHSLHPSSAFSDLFETLDDGARISCEPRQLDVADCFCAAQWKANDFG